jgi:hypothetical protein
MADLRECLDQLRDTGRVGPFELGRRDISIRFNIPQMIVGRDEEIRAIYHAFERVSLGSTEVMLVGGEPGGQVCPGKRGPYAHRGETGVFHLREI